MCVYVRVCVRACVPARVCEPHWLALSNIRLLSFLPSALMRSFAAAVRSCQTKITAVMGTVSIQLESCVATVNWIIAGAGLRNAAGNLPTCSCHAFSLQHNPSI